MAESKPPNLKAGSGELAGQAHEFAAAAHAGQTRKGDDAPYITHPEEVARLLHAESLGDEALLAAAFLHDVVEDTPVTQAEIDGRFGTCVGELVAAMTEDKSIPEYECRKSRHRDQVEASGPRASSIYLADKIANIRDMRKLYAAEGESASNKFSTSLDVRVRLWWEDVALGERIAPDRRLVAILRSELNGFEAERAASA